MALPLGAMQVVVVSFVAFALAVIALILRLWSRRIKNIPLALHDYLVIAAGIFTVGILVVFLLAAFAAGLGVHVTVLLATAPWKFALHMKLFVPAQPLWAAANSCVKFSILSLYVNLFPVRWFTRVCYGTMAVTIAYFIMVLLETFLLCKPVQYNWDKSIQGTCDGERSAYLAAGIINLLIDIFIVVLPMPLVFRLQMNLVKRISVAAMFSLGAVICVISLMRVLWLASWDTEDLTFTVKTLAIYSILEPTLGIVNACLPTMKPALVHIFGPSGLNWSRRSTSKTSNLINTSRNRKLNGNAKGGLTREFERLDDEFPLHAVQVQSFPNHGRAAGNNITVDREFRVTNVSEETV